MASWEEFGAMQEIVTAQHLMARRTLGLDAQSFVIFGSFCDAEASYVSPITHTVALVYEAGRRFQRVAALLVTNDAAYCQLESNE